MKTELGESPVAFKLDLIGKRAQVTFFENAVESAEPEGAPRWQADMYTLNVPWRPGLQASVEANYQAWLNVAKAQEEVLPAPTIEQRVDEVEQTVILIAEVIL